MQIPLDPQRRMQQLPRRPSHSTLPMPLAHVIASCTDRKRLPVPPRRRMRNVRARDLDRRFEAWQRALSGFPALTTDAANMYCGDHWSIARELPQTASARGWQVRLWVASAGYGLIPANAAIASYSATFAPGHPDSVAIHDAATWREGVRRWWQLQGTVPGPESAAPRSITNLASTAPDAMVVLASAVYVDAMEDDLQAARNALEDQGRLTIVSGKPRRETALRSNWVETDARLRQVLGGAVGSLHARVTRHLLTTLDPAQFSAAAAREATQGLLASAPPLPVYERVPSTDNQVAAFIRRALRRTPTARHTPLLREYRASGRQCEQSRFRMIFERLAEES